jgi:2'-5' RNA ligase
LSLDPLTGVFRLSAPIPTGQYESALVFNVAKHLREAVLKIRRSLPYEPPLEFQLDPHVTVLYLGKMPSETLLGLSQGLLRVNSQPLSLQCDGFGTFQSGDLITNLHVRFRFSDALDALHKKSLETCNRQEWKPSTSYIGRWYVPHITILDQIEIPKRQFQLPDDSMLPAGPIKLSDLHQIAKRLG